MDRYDILRYSTEKVLLYPEGTIKKGSPIPIPLLKIKRKISLEISPDLNQYIGSFLMYDDVNRNNWNIWISSISENLKND